LCVPSNHSDRVRISLLSPSLGSSSPLPVTISRYIRKNSQHGGQGPPLQNNAQLIDIYNAGSNNPSGNVPIISPSRLDQAISSSHHYQSPSGSTNTNTATPQNKGTLSGNSPLSMTSPSGMGMGGMGGGMGSMGTPTYSTDSIVGDYNTLMDGAPLVQLKKYLEPYSQDELRKLLMDLSKEDLQVCRSLLAEIKRDKKWCKLFVHGLSFSTSKETLEKEYSQYGVVKEAVVLVDKKGQSKGYGFVTFENAEEALKAAKDPKKRIDARMTHCNLAFKGNPKKFSMANGSSGTGLSPKQRENANDRRLFVHSLAWKTTDDSLAQAFSHHGQLQEAVVIRDKKTGKSKGYGFVTYKYSESAQAALRDPNKKIDGRQTHCNYACERSGDGTVVTSPNSGMGMGAEPMSMNSPNQQMNLGMAGMGSTMTPNMASNGHSNTPSNMMGQGQSNQPAMSTFGSNPLSLGPISSPNRNSSGGNGMNGMNGGMHPMSNTPNLPSMQSPNANGGGGGMPMNGMGGMGGMSSLGQYTSPSYGQSQSPYGHQAPQYSHPPPPSQQFVGSHPQYAPHDIAGMSMLRGIGSGRPTSPPLTTLNHLGGANLSGLSGVSNAAVGISTLLPRNSQPADGVLPDILDSLDMECFVEGEVEEEVVIMS